MSRAKLRGPKSLGLIWATVLIGGSLNCASAQTAPPSTPAPAAPSKLAPCDTHSTSICEETKQSKKLAEKHYKRGLETQKKGQFEQALEELTLATRLSPLNTEYIGARENLRQQFVHDLLDRGNKDMAAGRTVPALALFRRALEVDPGNDFARQRIFDAMPPLPKVRAVNTGSEFPQLRPAAGRKSVRLAGPAPLVLDTLCKTFGLTVFVDPSVAARQVNITLQEMTWEEASDLIATMTKTFWFPIAPNQVIFAANDEGTRRSVQRMGLRTFYIESPTTAELSDIGNSLRVLFDIRFLVTNPTAGTVTVRAPQPALEAATRYLEQLSEPKPQVLIDVQVFSVSRNLVRDIGAAIPNSFTIFNVPTEAQKLLGGQSIQSIISQLESTGNITNALSGGLAGLLAQALTGGSGSPLTSPFVSFGGGITLTGITVPGTSVKLNVNESSLQSLQRVSVRANQGTPATVKLGQRYPIILSSYSGAFQANSALSNLLGGQNSLNQAIPAIQYEDLGLNLKATPRVAGNGLVSIDLEMQIRALAGQVVDGNPVITNREFKSSLSTRDGQTIAVAGLVSNSESRLMTGIPGLSQVPIVNLAVTNFNKNINDDEVLVVMTPHIVSSRRQNATPWILLPSSIQR